MKAKGTTKSDITIKTRKLSSKSISKRPPINPVVPSRTYEIDYFHFFESLYRKEISDWQEARTARRDPFNPITYPLQQCYKDAMLDNHLSGAIENRILQVVNKQFFLKDKNGNIDQQRSAYIQTRWFRTAVTKAMESLFFGYSVLFINNASAGNIQSIKLVPRENVIPEKRIIVKNPFGPNSESISIDDFPFHLIYIQLSEEPYGMLERIAPLTIFKRHSWAAWDEFEQIFGVPIRIARTTIDAKKHREDLAYWLNHMGLAGFGVFDKRVDLEIKENNKSDAFNVFAQKINLINKEISKAVLGQTMTMEDGSSYSQAQVHMQMLNEIVNNDIASIESWFNDEFVHIMRAWGYDIPDGYYLDIVANTSLDATEKIKIDEVLMRNGWNLDKDYIENTYEVKLDENQPRNIQPTQETLQYDGEPDFFV